jgi:predicted amidohydrolase
VTLEPAPLTLALAQYRIEPGGGVARFAEKLAALVVRARALGAELLVLPEYAALEAAASPEGPDVAAELRRALALGPELLAVMREVARGEGIWILGGSLPMPANEAGRVVNRAPLIAADGRIAFQEKRVMTRFEREEWGISAGAEPAVFETPWGLLGISICYDVEFPDLVRAQTVAGAWAILVPACTDTLAGFNRVRLSARARALENQCFVAITPTVGLAPEIATLDANRGYAAVFGPVDRGFPEDGVLARGPLDEAELVLAWLDPARLARVRREGAVRNFADWPASPAPAPRRPLA